MKVLHITLITDGYEEVELIANAVSPTNSLAVISIDEALYFTGGIILQDTPDIRILLNSIEKQYLYRTMLQVMTKPYIKQYYKE